MSDCVFCQIVAGERSADVVAETERLLAFLDARPLFAGHTLVIPKAHVDDLDAMPDDLAGPLLTLVRDVSRAFAPALAADGSFAAINTRVSQSVPHLHVHVVPRRRKDGLRGFFWPRTRYEDAAAAAATAAALRAALARRGLTPARIETADGLPVIRVPAGTPPITRATVRRALDED